MATTKKPAAKKATKKAPAKQAKGFKIEVHDASLPPGHDLAGEIPTTGPANLPQRVIDNLCGAKTVANDYAVGYSEAVKRQAEKYKCKPGALRRYIAALVADKTDDAAQEADELSEMIMRGKVRG